LISNRNSAVFSFVKEVFIIVVPSSVQPVIPNMGPTSHSGANWCWKGKYENEFFRDGCLVTGKNNCLQDPLDFTRSLTLPFPSSYLAWCGFWCWKWFTTENKDRLDITTRGVD